MSGTLGTALGALGCLAAAWTTAWLLSIIIRGHARSDDNSTEED